MSLAKLYSLPTWFVVWYIVMPIIDRTKPDHPWYRKPTVPLDHWNTHATPICKFFDAYFWFWLCIKVPLIIWVLS